MIGKTRLQSVARGHAEDPGHRQSGGLARAGAIGAQPLPRQSAQQSRADGRERRNQPFVVAVLVVEHARDQVLIDPGRQAALPSSGRPPRTPGRGPAS